MALAFDWEGKLYQTGPMICTCNSNKDYRLQITKVGGVFIGIKVKLNKVNRYSHPTGNGNSTVCSAVSATLIFFCDEYLLYLIDVLPEC